MSLSLSLYIYIYMRVYLFMAMVAIFADTGITGLAIRVKRWIRMFADALSARDMQSLCVQAYKQPHTIPVSAKKTLFGIKGDI